MELGFSGDVQEVSVFNPIHNWQTMQSIAGGEQPRGKSFGWPLLTADQIWTRALAVNMAWVTSLPKHASSRRLTAFNFHADSVLGQLLARLQLPRHFLQDVCSPSLFETLEAQHQSMAAAACDLVEPGRFRCRKKTKLLSSSANEQAHCAKKAAVCNQEVG